MTHLWQYRDDNTGNMVVDYDDSHTDADVEAGATSEGKIIEGGLNAPLSTLVYLGDST